jgi:F0F1-type ATP synthase membrane subunit b/b'
LTLFALAGGAIQLVPDGTLLLHLGLIVVMVILLNSTLLKPINRVLTERERRTKGSATEARTVLTRVSEKMNEYEQRLRSARATGYLLLEEERSKAWREREPMVAGVKAEVARWGEEEKEKLTTAGEVAKAQLTSDARARASEIGGRILGRSL